MSYQIPFWLEAIRSGIYALSFPDLPMMKGTIFFEGNVIVH